MIPESYKGREPTFVKHTLLSAYLERLFMILGQFEKTICYVDCFAGPWQEESDELEGTSIAISLKIMEKCRNGLLKSGKNVQFRALFIEKDKTAFNRLENFLVSKADSKIQTKAMQGEFIDLREEILNWCGSLNFTFFFIDPKGWKDVIESETLRPLLQRKNSEYLINFMFDFIRRTLPQTPFEKHMEKIFGRLPDTSYMKPEEKEEYLLKTFCARLKEGQGWSTKKPRAAYVKILYSTIDRTKYYLVYLTRHPKGIQVFMDISDKKVDFIQKRVRAHVKEKMHISKTRQPKLFSAEIDSKPTGENLNEVKIYWLNKLAEQPKKFGVGELADMLEETGWFESEFQAALKELLQKGKVKNIDSQKIRPKKVVDFDKGEQLMRI